MLGFLVQGMAPRRLGLRANKAGVRGGLPGLIFVDLQIMYARRCTYSKIIPKSCDSA